MSEMTREEARNEIDYLINDGVVTELFIVPLEQKSIDALKVAKEALQERPKGRWHTLHETKLTKTVECTHCNTPFRYQKKGNIIVDDFYYCPNCGRPMGRR